MSNPYSGLVDRNPYSDLFAQNPYHAVAQPEDFSDVSFGSSTMATDADARERKRRQLAEARAHGDLGMSQPSTAWDRVSAFGQNVASGMKQLTDVAAHLPGMVGRGIGTLAAAPIQAAGDVQRERDLQAMAESDPAGPTREAYARAQAAVAPVPELAPDRGLTDYGLPPIVEATFKNSREERERLNAASAGDPGVSPVEAALNSAIPQTIGNLLDPVIVHGVAGGMSRRVLQAGIEQGGKTATRDVLEEEAPRLFDRRGIPPDPGHYGPLTAEEEAALAARRAATAPPVDSLPIKSVPRAPEPIAPEIPAPIARELPRVAVTERVTPMRAFHGSLRTDLSVLRDGSPRQFDNATSPLGVFFTPDEVEAARYAGKAGRVYPADLPLQNPKEMPWSDFSYYQDITHGPRDADGFRGPSLPPEEWPAREAQLKTEVATYRQDLEAAGHDGVIVRNRQGEPIEIASFKDVPVAPERPSLSDLFADQPAQTSKLDPMPEPRLTEAPSTEPLLDTLSSSSKPLPPDAQPLLVGARDLGPLSEQRATGIPQSEPAAAIIPHSASDPGVLPGMEAPEPPYLKNIDTGERLPMETPRTGTKNAVTAAEREARGLPEVEAIAHKGEGWDEARQIYEKDPMVARGLAAHVAEKSRPLSGVEESLLMHDRMRLTLDYNDALGAEEAALKAGDTEGAAVAKIRRTSIEAAMNTNDAAARAGGSEWSATGRARQKLIAQDFSPLKLVQRYRVANAGAEAPEAVRAKLVEIGQQLEAARAGQTTAEEKLAQREAELAVRSVQKDAAAATRRAGRQATREQLDTEYHGLLAQLDKAAAARQTEVKAVLTPLGGLHPDTAKLIAQLAKNRVRAGVNNLGELVDGIFQDIRHSVEGLEPRDIRDVIASGAPARQQMARSQAVQDLAKLRSQAKLFQKLDALEAGEQLAKRGPRATPPAELAAIRQKAREVADLMGVSGMSDEARIAAARTRVLAREKELTDQIASGLFVKKTRPASLVEPPDLIAARARVKGLQDQANGIIRRRELADRTFPEKALDLTAGWGRFLKLTGTATVQKIAAAASERALVFKPLEEFIGAGASNLPGVRAFAAHAPIEGGGSLDAVAKSYAGFFGKKARQELAAGFAGKEGPWTQALGKTHPESGLPNWMAYPGRVHAGLKAPAKIAAYEFAMEKQAKYYLRLGKPEMLNPKLNPANIAMMKARAVEYAERDIFMGDNALVKRFRKAFGEEPGAPPPSLPMRVWNTAGNVAMPIVKVPTNYALEVTHYLAGVPKAGMKMGNVVAKGLKATAGQGDRQLVDIVKAGLDSIAERKGGRTAADQADQILMNLKKGSLGAGLIALGATGAVKVGGYYHPGEHRSEDELKPGQVQIGGHDTGIVLPHNLLHHPAVEALQVGGTIYRAKNLTSGLEDSAWGVAEQVPFFEEPITAARDLRKNPSKFLGQFERGMTLPPNAQSLARVLDQKEARTPGQMTAQELGFGGLQVHPLGIDVPESEPVKRKPRGSFGQKLLKEEELGIPGLRPYAGGPP